MSSAAGEEEGAGESTPILILGARVSSRALAARLRTGLKLAQRYEDAPVVVSGLGEAPAMARWLIARGIRRERVVEETRATSTNENLENAHALLPQAAGWLVVTNGFHALRTRAWAHHLGLRVTIVAARSPGAGLLLNALREAIALPHSLLRMAWRRITAARSLARRRRWRRGGRRRQAR